MKDTETLSKLCMLKPRDPQPVTSLMLKRELEHVRRELRNLKTGQRGETFAKARKPFIEGAQNFEDLEQFLEVLQTRYGNIPVYCDQKVCLREVVHRTARKLGLPTGVTVVEQSQADGRAQQRVRALRERLQILVEDARRRRVEIILDHLVAECRSTRCVDTEFPYGK